MIGFLKGVLLASAPDNILLDVNGVGYAIHIPFSTYCEIEANGPNDSVSLYIKTHVREDALELYGFLTEEEKRVFDKLISVSGIGPRLAQVIMSGMGWEDLLNALAQQDATRLTRIPGVGKKTAERMILELKEAAAKFLAENSLEPARVALSPQDDLISALENLGYRKANAEQAAAMACQEAADGAPFAELLRLSLKKLSRA